MVVVKSGSLEILVLKANWYVASNKAILKQGNDGLTATKGIFRQVVN